MLGGTRDGTTFWRSFMKTNKEEIETLLQFERESNQKQTEKNFQWIKDKHLESAIMLPPGSKIKKAHDIFNMAIEYAKSNPDSKSTFSWEPTDAYVNPSNNMGYVYGVTRDEKEDGRIEIGKYLSVWIKDGDDWKVAIETRNLDE